MNLGHFIAIFFYLFITFDFFDSVLSLSVYLKSAQKKSVQWKCFSRHPSIHLPVCLQVYHSIQS